MSFHSPTIWISWEKHRRTREIAASLPAVRLYEIDIEAARVIRYAVLLCRTLSILLRDRPKTVIVQNPSIVLSLFMVTIGRLFTENVVVDAHNEGLKPFYAKHAFLLPIYKHIQKAADLTIVTNRQLAEYVRRNGGKPFVLEDRLPRFGEPKWTKLKGKNNIVLICTFEKDEPFWEVVESARKIPDENFIYITGKKEKAGHRLTEAAPGNIIFTGFLPDQEYANLLFSCDAVMDLTYMEDCLVCGAYEALALDKPMILSDTQALRNYFNLGSVFTRNDSDAIADAVQEVVRRKEKLTEEVTALKKKLQVDWSIKFAKLNEIIKQFETRSKICN